MTDFAEGLVAKWRKDRRGSRAAPEFRKLMSLALPSILFAIALLGFWVVMTRVTASPLVPGVGEVVDEMRRIVFSGLAIKQIGITFARILPGFVVAFVVSLVVGIAAARNSFVRRSVNPAIILGLTVPGLVWTLLCVIWFWRQPDHAGGCDYARRGAGDGAACRTGNARCRTRKSWKWLTCLGFRGGTRSPTFGFLP